MHPAHSNRIKDSERTKIIAEYIKTGKSPDGFEVTEVETGKYRVRRNVQEDQLTKYIKKYARCLNNKTKIERAILSIQPDFDFEKFVSNTVKACSPKTIKFTVTDQPTDFKFEDSYKQLQLQGGSLIRRGKGEISLLLQIKDLELPITLFTFTEEYQCELETICNIEDKPIFYVKGPGEIEVTGVVMDFVPSDIEVNDTI